MNAVCGKSWAVQGGSDCKGLSVSKIQPLAHSQSFRGSSSYRGSSLWNFVNYNDKEAVGSPNFNYLRKRVSAENFF